MPRASGDCKDHCTIYCSGAGAVAGADRARADAVPSTGLAIATDGSGVLGRNSIGNGCGYLAGFVGAAFLYSDSAGQWPPR